MKDFVAIDFETANQNRSSVCSVGLVFVQDGRIIERFYSLIYPRPSFFVRWTTEIHGLTMEDVKEAPLFPEVWSQVSSKIKGLPLVAHNSPFDEGLYFPVVSATQIERIQPFEPRAKVHNRSATTTKEILFFHCSNYWCVDQYRLLRSQTQQNGKRKILLPRSTYVCYRA